MTDSRTFKTPDGTPTRVTCVGVGNVGRAWAICFARGGCDVTLFDANPEALAHSLALIDDCLADLAQSGAIEEPGALRRRLRVASDLDEALATAEYVQESVLEDLDLKRGLIADIDRRVHGRAIIGSSTSEFMASQFAAGLPGEHRILVAHPFNPPYLIPVVEVAAHPATDPGVVAWTREFMLHIGMSPVVLEKEIKAFLLNRLQYAVVAEALHLVGEGYCSPEDLDSAMRDGLAMRWAFMGPFMTGHLNATGGYREYMRVYGDGFRRGAADLKIDYDWDLSLVDRIADAMEARIARDRVEEGQRWRNRRLAALATHLKDAEPID